MFRSQCHAGWCTHYFIVIYLHAWRALFFMWPNWPYTTCLSIKRQEGDNAKHQSLSFHCSWGGLIWNKDTCYAEWAVSGETRWNLKGFCVTGDDKVVSPSVMYISRWNYMNKIYFPALQSTYTALLDSGVNYNIISPWITWQFANQHFPITTPLTLTTADGLTHKNGLITEALSTLCKVGNHWTQQTFLVADLGPHNVFLGFPWFFSENPRIDWTTGTIAEKVEVNATAMDLAIKAKQQQLTMMLPIHLAAYETVFSEVSATHIPPSRSYDLHINLKPDFVPKLSPSIPAILMKKKSSTTSLMKI